MPLNRAFWEVQILRTFLIFCKINVCSMSILRRFCGRKTQIFRKIWVGFLSVGKNFSHEKTVPPTRNFSTFTCCRTCRRTPKKCCPNFNVADIILIISYRRADEQTWKMYCKNRVNQNGNVNVNGNLSVWTYSKNCAKVNRIFLRPRKIWKILTGKNSPNRIGTALQTAKFC